MAGIDADGLRRQVERRRIPVGRERPEQLRGPARRPREQAERLEAQAEGMEGPAPPAG
jgi:hypothetical protein